MTTYKGWTSQVGIVCVYVKYVNLIIKDWNFIIKEDTLLLNVNDGKLGWNISKRFKENGICWWWKVEFIF